MSHVLQKMIGKETALNLKLRKKQVLLFIILVLLRGLYLLVHGPFHPGVPISPEFCDFQRGLGPYSQRGLHGRKDYDGSLN